MNFPTPPNTAWFGVSSLFSQFLLESSGDLLTSIGILLTPSIELDRWNSGTIKFSRCRRLYGSTSGRTTAWWSTSVVSFEHMSASPKHWVSSAVRFSSAGCLSSVSTSRVSDQNWGREEKRGTRHEASFLSSPSKLSSGAEQTLFCPLAWSLLCDYGTGGRGNLGPTLLISIFHSCISDYQCQGCISPIAIDIASWLGRSDDRGK